MIYQVLLINRKGDEKDELEISLSISKALWKINEEKNNSVSESPMRVDKAEDILELS